MRAQVLVDGLAADAELAGQRRLRDPVGCSPAFAPPEIRGSAFGLLATVQAFGNVAASVVAGVLYTFASATVAFGYLAGWMVIALAVLGWAAGQAHHRDRVGPS